MTRLNEDKNVQLLNSNGLTGIENLINWVGSRKVNSCSNCFKKRKKGFI